MPKSSRFVTAPQNRRRPAAARRRELLLESCEERILCDAAPDVVLDKEAQQMAEAAALAQNTDAPEAKSPAPETPVQPTELRISFADFTAANAESTPAVREEAAPALAPTAATPRREVVFVDTSVPSYQSLLAGLSPEAQVVLLRQDQDGLQQMAATLAGLGGIDAIHLISHGSEASLTIGSTTLTTASMANPQQAALLASIGEALSADGDLLIYGCNFGKGADGLAATQTLARLTGADVAASTNNTGSTSLGGDWILEVQSGVISTNVAVSASAQAQWSGLLAPAPVQYFYIPLPEQAMLASMQAINNTVNGGNGMDSIITITATDDNTIIYYDQWENGYETMLSTPGQNTGAARTQIWGDGDITNGVTPGAAAGTDPAIAAGTVITLRNTVTVPRDAATVFYDAGDKIASTKTISISRAQIPDPTGSVISSAVEVRDTRYYDTTFVAPVGSNTPRPAGVNTLFSDNFLYVMASQNNTTVQIDADNNGVFEQTIVLQEGQNVVSTTNVLQGGRVVADKPVQANLFTGNDQASFATRSYSLTGTSQLSNDYFTPVGDSGDDVVLWVYNPNAAPITVSYQTRTGSGTLPVVAAGGTSYFVVPGDTGTRLYTAGGENFAALGAHDTAGEGSTHDWGFSLQPTSSLSQIAVVGLGVGNSSKPPSGGGINVSPVWVTPLAATTVYVDFDGNPNTGALFEPVTGTRYDVAYNLARLQTQRVTDTSGDNDNSGMRLFTVDGTLISTAWGEDTAAPAGSPGFDAGTTVPSLPTPEFYKFVDFAPGGDANGDGFYNSGDTLRYTLRLRNLGTQTMNNVLTTDVLPTSLVTYVNGTTYVNQGAGNVAVPDAGTTAFPLDEAGVSLSNVAAGSTTTVSFDVVIKSNLPSGTAEILNVARLVYQNFKLPATASAPLRGSVSGTVYSDVNNNGVQNAGETGIAGVTVTLTGTDITGAAVSKTTTTDAQGRYLFTGLLESNAAGYTVTETQPTGYADGLEARGGVVIAGSGGGANVITGVVVQPGELDINNNFGELGGTLSGTVYADDNNSGTKQAGEAGLAGVTVTLTGTDIAGNAVNLTAVTDASGNYIFTNLRQSNATGYVLTETQPGAYLDGKETAGSSGGTVLNTAVSQTITGIVLATNTNATGYLFGELAAGSLAGTVYHDVNANGALNAGETPLAGVTITLTGTNDFGAISALTATTDASGNYSFANLRPGTYTLTETQPAAYIDGKETAGTLGGAVTNTAVSQTISTIAVAAGNTGTGYLFGEVQAGSLAGTVYRDLDNDGVIDAGEAGVSGVTVTLTGTNDFGQAVSVTATTTAAGAYSFTGLRPGTYALTETQPAGLLDGTDTLGTVNAVAAGTLGSDTFTAIVLPSAGTGANYNFGELPASSVAGRVYDDRNNNGAVDAGESGIGSISIQLTGTDDLGAAVSLITTTAADGTYSFTGLRPGSYTVKQPTQPGAFLDGRETAGSLGGSTATNEQIGPFTLAANTAATGYNFGELAASSLSGIVYVDANNNGVVNAGETLLPGVGITLTGTNDLGQAVSLSTTTNASGAYSFTNLRPGTYVLTETQPGAYLDGRETVGAQASGTIDNLADSNTISAITLVPATIGSGNNFGELTPSSLAGSIWSDANNNGVFNAGEAAIVGATVTLTGTDDRGVTVNTTATTTATGAYTFANLRPGSYVLTETQPAGFLDGKDTLGSQGGTLGNDTVTGITLAQGVTGTNNNFAELAPGALSGTVYRDLNNNGAQSGAGETGIAGVTVTLSGTDDLGAAVSASATTDSNGNYSFANVRPGTYTLTETQPAGFLDGKETAGTLAGTVNNAAVSQTISNFTVTAGANGTGYLFGEFPAASVSGTVFRDDNADGAKQAAEPGLNGVTVTLSGTNDFGAVTLTTTTDATGAFSFTNLRPGTYTLTETQPAGYLDGKETAGTLGGAVNNTAISQTISTFTVASGDSGTGYLFADVQANSLAGTVYRDLNNDGVIDAGETGVSGTTITLTGTDDFGQVVNTTATTTATGTYSFTGLRPGTYTLSETQPAGLLDGRETLGTVNATPVGIAGSDTFTGVVLQSAGTGAGYNFGELPASSVAGRVYQDHNNNGTIETGEAGVSGVTIQLTGTDDLGNAVSLSTTTNAGGNYTFSNLRPGSYTVVEPAQPAAYLDGRETAGTLGGSTAINEQIGPFNLAANTAATGYNFGELSPATLSGTVYRDANNNGVKGAAETGIGGVLITLTGTDDRGVNVNLTTTTDASGVYSFANVRPGTYTLTETQPVGFLDGKETAGALGGTVDNTADSNTISGIVVTDGDNGTGYLFGELQAGGITGNVFIDLDNDGNLDAGEAPIAGVTITLTGTDDRGDAVNVTATSDATGAYAFSNLRPGTYTVTEAQPAAYLDGKDKAGTPGGGTVGNDVISNITVTSGVTAAGYRFGELPSTSISGSTYVDADNDGVFDAGESALPGVTITLTGTNDLGQAVNLTTISGATGSYGFTGLRPGTYAVTETQPAGYLDGKDTAGSPGGGTAGDDAVTNITLASGVASTGHNFGELRPASLAGNVYHDANNNGAFDAGDSAISGATITLTGTDDLGNAVNVTATSNAAGAYAFNNLRPGSYTLTETQPAGYLDGQDTRGTQGGTLGNDTVSAINLTEGTAGSGNNFGELQGASIAGSVYRDANNDGVLDAGENGVAGVTVTLTGTDDLGQAVLLSTTTNATGAYAFSNLRPGTYSVAEAQPAGLLDGTDAAGTPGGGTAGNDLITGITLVSGRASAGNNFGELDGSSISGSVYIDASNDGTFQAGETPRAGVAITLTGTDDRGGAINLTTTTNAAGLYAFANLRPGSYTVTETQPAGLLDGKDTAAVLGGGTAGNDVISGITLIPARDSQGNNFGELRPSSIGGSVWSDVNNDGVFDASETPIAGAEVTLTGTDDRGDAVSLTATTDATGAYKFNTLRPGTYVLTETQPAGFLDGKDARGTQGGTLGNDTVTGIIFTEGTVGTGNNFAELAPAALSGTVYRDDNNDGARQVGEVGLGSVTVTLTGTDDLGNAVSATVQTAADGTYSFTGLRPGTYALTESQLAAYLDGKDAPGSLGGSAAAVPGDTVSGIVVGSAQSGTGYNFGELAGSSIAGSVFIDADNDGVLDAGETLLPGVSVTLAGTNDLGQPVYVTATTDANGAYTFSNLRPGTYTVTETQPPGYLDGKDTAGTANGTVGADAISAITLPSNTVATGYTFGELRAASLSGTVFSDANNDGVRDAGETGIAATITLTGTDDLGQAVSLIVTSDATTGAYDFSGLRPGTYTITETQPAAFLDGRDALGTTGGTLANDKVSAITIAEGAAGTSYNFGELAGSSLAGTVYRDDNNNGLLDGGEARIAGVTITLSGVDDLGHAVLLTATSDAAGAYSFGNLRPSDAAGYTITETEPSGYLMGKNAVGTQGGATTNNPPSSFIQTVQIAAGTTGTGNNFGELAPSSLSGTAYIDANNDGVLDAGETRLPGVAITLTGTNDLGQPVSVSTTTDATGAYIFSGLRPGTYTVSEAQPAGYLDGRDTAGTSLGTVAAPGDAVSAITLTSNTPATGYNFGELRGASLSGSVFRDDNNDGMRQASEPGVGGVSVRLRGTDDLGNVIDTTIATQPDGTYVFANLRPGTYRVTEMQPAGLLDGRDAFGTRGGTLANDDVSGIVLSEGDAATGYTFGELGGSRVAGTVFDDRNNDGVRDAGETGIPGTTVMLIGLDDLGQPVSLSAVTDLNGNYQFTGLRPGEYMLMETQPAGFLDGKDTAGAVGGNAASVPGDTISAIALPSNTDAGGYLFGDLTPASLSGTVYRDDSNDGVRQAGEPGIGNVSVTLTGTDDLGNSVSLSTSTAVDGTYSFANLRPGTYTLSESQPVGYLDGRDAAGTQGGSVTATPGDSIASFTFPPGQSGAGNNFGELSASSISGQVFDDRDNDGTQDVGEFGLPGVTLTLTGTDDLGQPVTLTTTTGPTGGYTFGNLRPGVYTLAETQPAGYLDGIDTPGSLSGTATSVPSDTISAITLPSNTAALDYTFAEVAPSSLGGSVFADPNNDGVRDAGENGIGGVNVTLTGTDDLGQAVNITLATAPDGTFDFTNLRPGTYTVTETQPAAYADGKDTVGTLNGTLGNDTVAAIVVTPGQTGTGYTFGEQLTSITGTVFLDRNRDGVQDSGETGLSGVTITLLDKDGNFVASTTTGPAGDYAFASLVSGSYRLVETQPMGYGSSTANSVDINVSPTGEVVRFGETISSISGTVYFDANQSGSLNGGFNPQTPGGPVTTNPGLGGVLVTLTGTDATGATVTRTTTTDADGTYRFDDLLAGNYTLTEGQPPDYRDGSETAGTFGGSLATNDEIAAIVVPAGADGPGNNFGELGVPVTGVVYRDDNRDGVHDPGETGLPGVTMELLDPQTMLPIATVTTGPDGRYTFENQPPGSYIVRETQPGGYADTTVNELPIAVSAPGMPDVDFGEALGSMSGRVFLDRNNDGLQDPGELGIPGVTVTLTGTDVLGQQVTRTATTNAMGDYTIDNLLAGTYTLTETQPAGYNDGKDSVGTSNGTLSAPDSVTGIVLGAGVITDGYNFGELGATDLTVAKDDGVTEVQPGQLITYTVTVSNQGVQDAAGVVVSDQFPIGDLEFISASNGGVFDALTGTITWQLGDVTGSGQEVVTLTVQARVRDVVLAGHELVTNVVTVSDDGSVPDSDPENNRATDVDRLIAQPDLYVVKTDHLTTAQVGQTVTYTLTGGNAGNQTAEGVTVTDLLPPGLRFVSASHGGRLVNGQVVWKLSDLQPGDSFRITVTVAVEDTAENKNAHNTAKIDDRYGSFEDPTPRNNRASDDTFIPKKPYVGNPPPAPYVGGAPLFYDLFNNGHNSHFRSFGPQGERDLFDRPASVLNVWRDPILPLAPIYSGEADPGSTLVIELFNANGDRIGEQTVMVDAGGNWLASFQSSEIKDYPSGVRITEYAAPYAAPNTSGRNLRNFFAPALNAGQFAFGGQDTTPLDPRASAPLLGGLNLANPLELGDVKYGSELLPTTGAPGGY